VSEAANSGAGLAVQGVGAAFGGVAALEDVTFEVAAGNIHGLIGPNGAGKTTLMNVISGFVRPTHGSVLLDGRSILERRAWERARFGIGRTFQTPVLIDRMTVVENVESGLFVRGHTSPAEDALLLPRSRREARERRRVATSLLEEVGIAAWARDRISTLPLGKRKLVDLVRACAARPRLLLLDEPTAGLGDDEIESVSKALERLRRSTTILVVAHHLEFVLTLADRVTVLDFGKVVADDQPSAIRADQKVIDVYIGRDE
jgi:ABC-type branched-subunit amino acid transport system ATPase component